MGIVVTVCMLLGLLMVSPLSWLSLGAQRHNIQLANVIGFALLFAGLWNSLWHGLRYLHSFWGMAALVSGVFMVLVAVIILKEYGRSQLASSTAFQRLYKGISPLSLTWTVGLLASLGLYAVTLVRLNLGLSIIH